MTIPTATLRVMRQPMFLPKPIGFDVQVDGKTVAVLDLEHVRAVWQQVLDMEAARETPRFNGSAP